MSPACCLRSMLSFLVPAEQPLGRAEQAASALTLLLLALFLAQLALAAEHTLSLAHHAALALLAHALILTEAALLTHGLVFAITHGIRVLLLAVASLLAHALALTVRALLIHALLEAAFLPLSQAIRVLVHAVALVFRHDVSPFAAPLPTG